MGRILFVLWVEYAIRLANPRDRTLYLRAPIRCTKDMLEINQHMSFHTNNRTVCKRTRQHDNAGNNEWVHTSLRSQLIGTEITLVVTSYIPSSSNGIAFRIQFGVFRRHWRFGFNRGRNPLQNGHGCSRTLAVHPLRITLRPYTLT